MNGQQSFQIESKYAQNVRLRIGIPSGAKVIPLTQGYITVVDEDDYEELIQYPWYVNTGMKGNTCYAIRHSHSENGKLIHISMHRQILSLTHGDGIKVDHKNWNGLDNRKENLRIAHGSINQWNIGMRKDNKSGYRGVSWNTTERKWYAVVYFQKVRYGCGYFHDIELAARAYDKKAFELFGKGAFTNFKGN